MRRLLLGLCAVGALLNGVAATSAQQPFGAGNTVVYRVGTGAAALSNAGTATFLDEYTPNGTFVQSLALPTSAAGANGACVASGTATSEGLLNLSPSRRFLTATCYNAAVGTAAVAGTSAAAVPRVVAVISAAGAINTATALTDFSTGNNPRSAILSVDDANVYAVGGAGGVRYAPVNATTSTQLSTTVANLRDINIFSGQLYVSTGSGTAVRVGTVGSGTPTTAGQTIANLPGFPTTGSPYQFVLLDLDAGVAGVDTLYVADDSATGGGIQKFSLVGGNWTTNGTVAGQYRGLTARVINPTTTPTVTLFATSAVATANTLVRLNDASGYNGTLTGTVTTIATAAANTAFRGVAFAPAAATAAAVNIGGRVFNAKGQPIRNARVAMTDGAGNTRAANTNSFGYYSFSEVAAGENYIFNVTAKGQRFDPTVEQISQETSELNFTAQP